MTRPTRRWASRGTGAAMIAAALLWAGEACAQPSGSCGPVSLLDNIFTGSFSQGSPTALSRRQPGITAQAQGAPAASSAAPPWSGEDGACGHPLMTASAIRQAAANFDNC